MIVSKRRYDRAVREAEFERDRAEVNLMLWLKEWDETKALNKEVKVTDQAITAAESALDYKDAVIEGLQDDLYRMHEHMQYVREVMADHP